MKMQHSKITDLVNELTFQHKPTVRVDDRSEAQRKTHVWLVTATDRFMSGWGPCSNGGVSKCAWACKSYEQAEETYERIKARSEMRYVNIVHGRWYPRNAAHVHIYVEKD